MGTRGGDDSDIDRGVNGGDDAGYDLKNESKIWASFSEDIICK